MSDGQLRGWLDALAGVGGAVSAIEVAVVRGGEERFRHAAGYRVGGERLEPGARFDAASLTKPWIASLALALDRDGRVALGTALGEVYPGCDPELAGKTLEDLLRHRSGLPAWTPIALRLGRRAADGAALEELLTRGGMLGSGAPSAPAGTYSDLGYLLWGLVAERTTGRSLAELVDRELASPLGLAPLGELAADPPRAVECRLDNGREVELARAQGFEMRRQELRLLGRPQDGNARGLGRLVGHAGLFATLDEQLALARSWLDAGPPLEAEAVARALGGGSGWALGWARASGDGSSGPALSGSAFGHAGFTGGSLWLDPERDLVVAVLAHRLDSATDFNPYRRELHRLAVEVCG